MKTIISRLSKVEKYRIMQLLVSAGIIAFCAYQLVTNQ